MTIMLKLTLPEGNPIWIAIQHIATFNKANDPFKGDLDGTFIWLTGDNEPICVSEEPEEVAKMIKDAAL